MATADLPHRLEDLLRLWRDLLLLQSRGEKGGRPKEEAEGLRHIEWSAATAPGMATLATHQPTYLPAPSDSVQQSYRLHVVILP